MTPDQPHESREQLSPLPPFVLAAYPELTSLGDQQTQWWVSAIYQHNRTIQQALETLSQPQSTSRFAASALTPIAVLVKALLDQLDEASASLELTRFRRIEQQLWVENRDRLAALLGTQI